LAPPLVEAGVRVIDLSGAFRIRDSGARTKWYPATKSMPEGAAYGLTEFFRDDVRNARLVANPGCYPTAALLSLLPLSRAGLLDAKAGVVIDAKSGISGAGRAPSDRTHFSENHGSVSAYGVFNHRHVAEMEQELATAVTFVPHLVPLDRGILETIYATLTPGTTAEQVADAFERTYRNEPFVRLVGETLPEIKHVAWTNFCDIGWRVDAGTRRLVIVSCIDNLVKGAAGQALQNFNVAAGIEERTGLR
jgi:N-acetyl-gamma-glutamyl-phosphate reductase